MLVLIYCIQLAFNYVVYIFKIKFLLRTFWLAFIFYQISRLCILLFFIFSVWAGVDHIETYIYAAILCVVSAYMFMANYFNTFEFILLLVGKANRSNNGFGLRFLLLWFMFPCHWGVVVYINYDYDLYYLLYVLSHLCVLWLRLK